MREEPRGRQLTLTVPNQPEYLPAVGDAARGVARIAGFDGDALEYVATVTTRLAGMLMNPALEPPEGGEIDVVCAQTSGGLHVALHDDGPPFDPSSVGVASDLIHGLLRGGSPDWVLFRNLGRGGKEAHGRDEADPPGQAIDAIEQIDRVGDGDDPDHGEDDGEGGVEVAGEGHRDLDVDGHQEQGRDQLNQKAEQGRQTELVVDEAGHDQERPAEQDG